MEHRDDRKSRGDSEGSAVLELLKTIVIAVVLAVLIKNFVFNTTLVIGKSMEPTLHQNERLVCLVFPLYFSDPARQDIVIIDAPDNSGKEYVKRVVGLPGDTVAIRDGAVFINGVALEEPYIEPGIDTEIYQESEWTLGEGEFFVMGDNRNPGLSVDSRYFGPVQKKNINSVAKLRFYPFNRAEVF
ncbi:MAG: signal peptidase I [Tissierellia bacterium]|nr:signal peptidase I [Tissierellia bacterium]